MRMSLSTKLKSFLAAAIICIAFPLTAKEIKGKVVSTMDGNPVSFAILWLKDSQTQVISDQNGSFSMVLPDTNDEYVISVSNTDYIAAEFMVLPDKNEYVIELTSNEEALISTLWRDYTTGRFNGSVQTITGRELTDVPTSILSNQLSGRIAGLTTIQSSGEPGFDGADVYIRRATPSVYIDGRVGHYRDVSVDDIETITVVRDATAAALYGVRNPGGAIIIKTKKGTTSAPSVTVKSQMQYNELVGMPNRVDAATHAMFFNQARKNSGISQEDYYSPEDIAMYRDGSNPLSHPNVEWKNELLKKGYISHNHHVSVAGGSDNLNYYVSVGLSQTGGMFKTGDDFTYSTNSEFTNYKLLSNIEFKPWQGTLVNFRLGGELQDNNYPSRPDNIGEVYSNIFTIPANAFPMYYNASDGYVDQTGNAITGIEGKIGGGNGININPWSQLNRNGYTATTTLKGMVQTSINQNLSFITLGLAVNGMIYFTLYGKENLDRRVPFANYEYMGSGNLYMRGSEGYMPNTIQPKEMNRMTSYELGLDYLRSFDQHTVYGDLLWNRYEDGNASDVPIRFESIGLSGGYDYDKRYSADVALAYGGSHKFAKGRKYHWYPTVAAGWNVSNEKFFEGMKKAISYMKLRASYGITGTNDAYPFAYMTSLAQVNDQYNTGNGMGMVAGVYQQQVANALLKDGKVYKFNTGLDLNFLHDRISLSVDYFIDHRKDLPLTSNMSYSQIFGYVNLPSLNVGHEKTTGVDIALRYKENRFPVRYFIGGNFSFHKNEIIEWDEPLQKYPWMYRKGHANGDFFGLVADGLYRTQTELDNATALPGFATPELGDIRYADLNDDNSIDEKNDSKWLGYGRNPRIYYGIQAGVSYKGFDLQALFQGAAQRSINIAGQWRNAFAGNTSIFEHQTDVWSAENQDAALPRVTVDESANNNRLSSFWLKDASYLRLKSLTLSYTLSSTFANKLWLKELRVFISGYNLLTWDKLDVIDPESTGDYIGIAPPRVYNIGLSLKF
ncbi:TonB-dependent receptor [Dysgonomonas termitidis]